MEPKRIWNPPNPYLTEHRQLLGEPPAAELEVYEDQSKSILSRNDSPDLGFRWSVNPYRGCFHACAYCVPGDTPILMGDGHTKPMADIRVGDVVYGTILRGAYRHGRYRYFVKTKVLAHWATVKPAYRITLEDGTELITSADHRLLTHRGWKHATGAEWGRARRPHLTLKNELIGTGRFATPPQEDHEYQQGYLCGMIRGDGLLASDTEALHRTQTYLSTFEVPTKQFVFQLAKAGYQPLYAIRAQGRCYVEQVRHLIQWPMAVTPSWRKGFLAGIFDAEGSYSRGILRLFNTSPDIIEAITDSVRHFGFDYAIEIRPGHNKPVSVVRLRGGIAEHLRFFLAVNPAITRKRDIAGQAIKNQARLRVTAVEPLELSLPMVDMTTETEDFIANGVVSHNCYARPTHEYFGLGAGTDFERKIFVKSHAPQLLEEAFRHPSWVGERIMFSGVTDCYQPLEAAWKLTRGCIEVCLAFRNPVGIVTKSLLIRRDAALLAALAREADAHVAISIPFLHEEMARAIEPGAPTIRRRFETMRILAEAGVPVGIGIAPIIPGLNDSDIAPLLKEAKRCGAQFAFHTLLRLPGSVKAVLFHRLRETMPDRARKIEHRIRETRNGKLYDSRFGHRHHGEGEYWELVEQQWQLWTRRFGFNQEDDPPTPSTFRRPPPRIGQLEFAWSDARRA